MSKKLDSLLRQLPNTITEKMIKSIKPVEGKIKKQIEQKFNDILLPYLNSEENHVNEYLIKEVFNNVPKSRHNYKIYESHPLAVLNRGVWLRKVGCDLTQESLMRYVEFVEKQKEIIILNERYKLLNTVDKKLKGLDIKSVKCIYASLGNQGVEGRFKISLKNDTVKTLVTQGIYAGGFNIQKLHLRYLSKID